MGSRILEGLHEQSCFYSPSSDSSGQSSTIPDLSFAPLYPDPSRGRAPSQPPVLLPQSIGLNTQEPSHRTWPPYPVDISDFMPAWAYPHAQASQPPLPTQSLTESLFGLDQSHFTAQPSPSNSSHCALTYGLSAGPLLPNSIQGNDMDIDMDFSASAQSFMLHHASAFDKLTSQTLQPAPPLLSDHSPSFSRASFSARSADPSSASSPAPRAHTRQSSYDTNAASAGSSTVARKSKSRSSAQQKSCTNCGVTATPMWRRNPTTHELLCNACGIYLQTRNKRRPLELCSGSASEDDGSDVEGASQADDGGAESSAAQEDWKGRVCEHCETKVTSVWRRGEDGRQLCNACGVYVRMKGKERPLHLRSNKVKPRFKHI